MSYLRYLCYCIYHLICGDPDTFLLTQKAWHWLNYEQWKSKKP